MMSRPACNPPGRSRSTRSRCTGNRTWVCVRLLLNRPWWLNLTCRLAVLDDLADPGPNTYSAIYLSPMSAES